MHTPTQIQISELGQAVHRLLNRSQGLLVAGFMLSVVVLIYLSNPGWVGLLWMGAGTAIALFTWKGAGIGLPLLPILAIQHFLVYGVPIVSQNPTIYDYPSELLTQSGQEIFAFLLALTCFWRIGMSCFHPHASFAYVLKALRVNQGAAHPRLGQILVLATTLYNVGDSLGMIKSVLEAFPEGIYSIVSALTKAATLIGYFLMGLNVGSNQGGFPVKAFFWGTLAVNSVIISSSLILSSATNLVAAVIIGLFWGSGRLPWRFLALIAVILSFLHLGKFEMRARHWDEMGATSTIALSALPQFYTEWMDASYRNLTLDQSRQSKMKGTDQGTSSVLARVNNLQNLLYAIDAVKVQNIATLNGETYALIPPLLIPRVLWPEKPRAHEGQVLLNVHFGRQTLQSSLGTYIAWGLVPEAYGNFGPLIGSLLLGAVLGMLIAWFENATVTKPVISLEGLLSLTVFTNLAVSYEMVSSVLITSLFQSLIIITLACLPFVERSVISPPSTPDDHEETETA